MDTLPPDFRLLRFSTEDFPADQRPAAWSAVMAKKLLRVAVETSGNGPFHADVMMRAQQNVRIATGFIGASISSRTPAITAADNDDAVLLVSLEGRMTALQTKRATSIQTGDALAFNCQEDIRFTFPAPVRVLLLRIPFATLSRYGAPREATSLRTIHRRSSALKLLIRYGATLFEDDDIAMTPGAARVMIDHMVDLVALAIGAPHDLTLLGETRNDAPTRLRVIKADILRNLTRRNLTVGWLAERHGLSTRQIYRMFERDGMAIVEYVREQRLIAAHRMIRNPRYADNSISAIALQCGFGDISNFNHRFRSKFGTSPSGVRGG